MTGSDNTAPGFGAGRQRGVSHLRMTFGGFALAIARLGRTGTVLPDSQRRLLSAMERGSATAEVGSRSGVRRVRGEIEGRSRISQATPRAGKKSHRNLVVGLQV